MSWRVELDDIQGNVLRGYGMPVAAHVAVRVDDAAAGRALLRELRGAVTDAREWTAGKPASTLNVAIASGGLEALGVAPEVLATFPGEFLQGMAARWRTLGDWGESAPAGWQEGLRDGEIHILVAVHALEADALDDALGSLQARIDAHAGLARHPAERTQTLPVSGPDFGREHFGFSDGFGQPDIAGTAGGHRGGGVRRGWRTTVRLGGVYLKVPSWPGWRPVRVGEFVLGYRNEDGVVAPAPAAPFGRNATFMVYRKLEQDVAGFRRLLDELAATHFSGDRELVAAKIAGRWRDGTPLMLSPDREDRELARDRDRTNDFRYARDRDGRICPLGAHVRRANPRDALYGGFDRTRRHRIVRRGMPYGPPLDPAARDNGDGARGLIFVAFNASISRQFETVNSWLLDGNAFGIGHVPDYLLANTGAEARGMTVNGDPPALLRAHRPLVSTRGGEYLYVPSLTALDALAARGRGAPRAQRDARTVRPRRQPARA